MKFEQITVEQYVWDAIADPKSTRRDVACAYAMALQSGEEQPWRGFNQAILERWSMAGLKFIKERAWRLATPEGKVG